MLQKNHLATHILSSQKDYAIFCRPDVIGTPERSVIALGQYKDFCLTFAKKKVTDYSNKLFVGGYWQSPIKRMAIVRVKAMTIAQYLGVSYDQIKSSPERTPELKKAIQLFLSWHKQWTKGLVGVQSIVSMENRKLILLLAPEFEQCAMATEQEMMDVIERGMKDVKTEVIEKNIEKAVVLN